MLNWAVLACSLIVLVTGFVAAIMVGRYLEWNGQELARSYAISLGFVSLESAVTSGTRVSGAVPLRG